MKKLILELTEQTALKLSFIMLSDIVFTYKDNAKIQDALQENVDKIKKILDPDSLETLHVFESEISRMTPEEFEEMSAKFRDVSASMLSDLHHGLNHDIEHLEAIRKKIPFMPIEEQAEFADQVTIKYSTDQKFIDKDKAAMKDFISGGIEQLKQAQMNTTAFGNMAYMAMHAVDPEYRELHLQALLYLKQIEEERNKTVN